MKILMEKREIQMKVMFTKERLLRTMFLMSCALILLIQVVQEQPLNVALGEYMHLFIHKSLVMSRTPPRNWNNLLVDKSKNYTSTLIKSLRVNATSRSPCYHDTTNATELEGLPETVEGQHFLNTDTVYHLTLVAYGTSGGKRCAGGDYLEVDLHDRSNVHGYRSRPPTVDFGNGSYGVEIIVPSRFAGPFNLEIWLLFGNWHGMDYTTDRWATQKLVVSQDLELVLHHNHPDVESAADVAGDLTIKSPRNLTRCTHADFYRTTWQGQWTRSWFNESCQPDRDKRFRCIPENHYWCEEPWCFGPVGRLESNGWVYSAHRSFKIYEREEAWKCLDKRWFLMWGDSNFQDTIRNMLLFILDWDLPRTTQLSTFELERNYEAGFVDPKKYDRLFRVSQFFNGAHLVHSNGEGLNSLKYEDHRQKILAHFNGTTWPDTIIMNSGLHDGAQFKKIEHYVASVDFAIQWWTELYNSIPENRRPQLIWRTTVAPAGQSRTMRSNPNKMEMYNQVMVEKLQEVRNRLPVKFIDGFDLTFPFHYNNNFSDGGHYGRAPGSPLRPWHGDPHWYFVDVMLAHIFLNAACPST